MVEEWRAVVGFEGYYEVSNLGNVRSLDRVITVNSVKRGTYNRFDKGKMLNLTINKNGYVQVGLKANYKSKSPVVHRLVAQAFIPNPENKPQVNHIDGDKTNNRLDNLEWCTQVENMKHASKNNLRPQGETHPFASLKEVEVLEIVRLLDSGTARDEIASRFNVNVRVIHGIHLGETWNTVTGRKGKVRPSDMLGANNPAARKIINCRDEVFSTMKEAGLKYNVSWTSISRTCRGLGLTAGTYADGTRIKWKYYNK